ncbi:MAG: glycerol-3-phosphate acyltransferase [Anaerolineae bacterium]|nr:glycerol-3-phosphate acyltransferase [Anaerolineae bacterium]
MWVKGVVAILVGYLLGSLPAGLFWGWIFRQIDVRRHGTGRTGGTNVWRTVGFIPAVLTALSDGLKGALAVWLAQALGVGTWEAALSGMSAVLGHNYSCFLGFRGGAGTATSVGAAAVLWGTALPLLLLLGVLVGLLVGHASVASISVAVALPVIFGLLRLPAAALGFGLPTMLLTLWALHPNIRRLLRREENFLPIFLKRPPPICLSRHPARHGE